MGWPEDSGFRRVRVGEVRDATGGGRRGVPSPHQHSPSSPTPGEPMTSGDVPVRRPRRASPDDSAEATQLIKMVRRSRAPRRLPHPTGRYRRGLGVASTRRACGPGRWPRRRRRGPGQFRRKPGAPSWKPLALDGRPAATLSPRFGACEWEHPAGPPVRYRPAGGAAAVRPAGKGARCCSPWRQPRSGLGVVIAAVGRAPVQWCWCPAWVGCLIRVRRRAGRRCSGCRDR